MTDLDTVSNQIEEILQREVQHLLNEESLDGYQIKSLEVLSKINDHALARRKGRALDDWTKKKTTQELEELFDEAE